MPTTVLDQQAFAPGQPGVIIVDDIGADLRTYARIQRTFSISSSFVDAQKVVIGMMQEMLKVCGPDAFIIFPGNGGWLMERLIERVVDDYDPTRKMGVDVSRDSDVPFEIPDAPSHIVVFEDLVGTGSTLQKILQRLRAQGVTCPVSAATLVWHDQDGERHEQAEKIFGQFDQVIVGVRIRSDNGDSQHVRSLSTLARKREHPGNHIYSTGKEAAFVEAMTQVLGSEPWVGRLGIDLGYRIDHA